MSAIALETAKSFLGVVGDADDDQIQLLIDAAVGEIEATTSTCLLSRQVKVLARSFSDLGHLAVGPVTAIVEITYRAGGARLTLPNNEAALTGEALERGIAIVSPPAGTDIEATLTVGYGAEEASIPAQLRWAALALIRGKFDDRPVDIEPLIANHRIWG